MGAQLPIYRSLNQKLRIFGFSLVEISWLAATFVILNQLTSFLRFNALIAALAVFVLGIFFRSLHRRFEENFLIRLIRFSRLPARVERKYQNLSSLGR